MTGLGPMIQAMQNWSQERTENLFSKFVVIRVVDFY